MKRLNVTIIVKSLLVMLIATTAIELSAPQEAEARAGRSRSVGRSSSYRQKSYAPRRESAQPNRAPNTANSQVPGQRSSFLRNVAGGLAGGFIGSMLFSSLGRAAGGPGTGGGIGLLEILLIGGLIYFGIRWYKSRQQSPVMAGGSAWSSRPVATSERYDAPATPINSYTETHAFRPAEIKEDEASESFFKVQGAWSRGDLGSIRGMLTDEMFQILASDLSDDRAAGRSNRIENIMIRKVEVTDAWDEGGAIVSPVKIAASLLDYTRDDATGRVVEGSETSPVKMEEIWTFVQPPGSAGWKLAGIEQV